MARFFSDTLFSISPFITLTVSGTSMVPTLKPGKKVLVSKLPYFFRTPHIGDIVAIYDPRDKKILVKRIKKDSSGEFFVMGDNKKESTDSRTFGWIKKKDIIGKVIF